MRYLWDCRPFLKCAACAFDCLALRCAGVQCICVAVSWPCLSVVMAVIVIVIVVVAIVVMVVLVIIIVIVVMAVMSL